MPAFLRLGVNVDHIATLRQARGTPYPDPVEGALLAAAAGNAVCAVTGPGPAAVPALTVAAGTADVAATAAGDAACPVVTL